TLGFGFAVSVADRGPLFSLLPWTSRSRRWTRIVPGPKPLAVEGDGPAARNPLDVLEPQWPAVTCQQSRVLYRAPAFALAEHHLWSFRLGEPIVAPFLQDQIGRKEIAALFGQDIVIPRGMFGQWDTFHDSGIDKSLQPVAQDVRRHTDVIFKFIEAPGAVIGLAQNEDGPAVADNLHRARHGTLRVGATAAFGVGDGFGYLHVEVNLSRPDTHLSRASSVLI